MIYTIKLTYCFKVQADNRTEAYRKAIQAMREEPGCFISSVTEGEFVRQRSLLSRIVFGW